MHNIQKVAILRWVRVKIALSENCSGKELVDSSIVLGRHSSATDGSLPDVPCKTTASPEDVAADATGMQSVRRHEDECEGQCTVNAGWPKSKISVKGCQSLKVGQQPCRAP